MPFTLLPTYTEHVLALSTPPFHENYKIGKLIITSRNRTPPYLSNLAEVKHVDLATVGPNSNMPILNLYSDGLCDFYKRRSPISTLPKDVQLWL